MKHIVIMVLVVSLALLLVGCGTQEETPTATTQAPQQATPTTQEEATLSTAQLDLYAGGFAPQTLRVKVGQNVVVTSYVEDNAHLSVPGLGVEEPMQKGSNVVFRASRAGSFEITCLTCEPAYFGTLIVSE